MSKSKIEWLAREGTIPVSWNPITGCTQCSAGCLNCYAKRMAARLAGRHGYPESPHEFDVTMHPDKLDKPRRWRKLRTVFVCSMSDLFHRDIPFDEIAFVFHEMARSPQHTYLVLTKRPEKMMAFLKRFRYVCGTEKKPPDPNIWLGTTIEKPEYSYRADYLRQCPAAVHFLSLEPLLGSMADCPGIYDDMDWVIAGGESGTGARPAHPDWFRDIRDRCDVLGIPFFFKQHGKYLHESQGGCTLPAHLWEDGTMSSKVGKKAAGHLLDGKEHHEWPNASST